jgi:hypothetical protein
MISAPVSPPVSPVISPAARGIESPAPLAAIAAAALAGTELDKGRSRASGLMP